MPRYVALLRGINVGGHRVKMDRLREIFADMGCEHVSTFIASGNVIFESDDADVGRLEKRIEQGLEAALGWPVTTFLRTPAELREVVAFEPADIDEEWSLYVIFLAEPASEALRGRLAEAETDSDRFRAHGREVYWSIHGKLSDSPFFKTGIERLMGARGTSRNITSLRRLVAKVAAETGTA